MNFYALYYISYTFFRLYCVIVSIYIFDPFFLFVFMYDIYIKT